MNTSLALSAPKQARLPFTLFTWGVVLLASDFTPAVWGFFIGPPPGWLFWLRVGLLGWVILSSWAWNRLQSLRTFFILLLVLILGLQSLSWISSILAYHAWQL